MGTLYVVATPIGNLEDMTLRALRILREVQLIAAEDTRTSRVLTQHFDITTPMTSYHEHNKLSKLDAIFDALATGDVALISDAGTPGINDPGYELVREAIARDYPVVPVPGANAALSALVASGLPTDSFIYLGFLPKKASARREALALVRDERRTLVAYENPHRVAETLAIVAEAMGDDRPVCVAREITKLYETFFRGTVQQAHEHFAQASPRGEVTLVIGGAPEPQAWDEARVRASLRQHLSQGEPLSRAARAVAGLSGWKKSDVYALGVGEDAL